MRHLAAILLACCALVAHAQNWALLNPAYRYNYSNDGTDTISNQIRVMQVDTLGPDSFRYELNRIGVVCDTCPASLGGPCDGCFIWVDQPQFLQHSTTRSGGSWWFFDPDTFLIRTDVPVGTSWPFYSDTSMVATVQGRTAHVFFGIPDSVLSIGLSNGDSLILSRSFGLIRFPGLLAPEDFVSLGVHGPNVGKMVPSLEQFFPFQPGDVVQFRRDWNSSMHWFSDVEHFHIQQRNEQPGVLTFTGVSYHRSFGPNGQDNGSWVQQKQWTLDLANDPVLSPINVTPGQMVALEDDLGTPASDIFRMIAEHGTDSSGNYFIRGHSFGYSDLFHISDTLPGLLAPLEFAAFYPNKYYLDNALGLRLFSTSAGIDNNEFRTQGAIIGGDTIGVFDNEEFFHVVITESSILPIWLIPNPASDAITLIGVRPGHDLTIHDLEGRLIRTARITSSNETISVQDLQPGSYLLRIDGHRPQRFIIAR